MKYTQENLEKVLEKINPKAFDIYKNKAKLALPEIVHEMFAIGFNRTLKGSAFIDMHFSRLEMSILMRAYDNIAGEGKGYFEFEE